MSDLPPYPSDDAQQPGWGNQQPPGPGGGWQQPGPPGGWGQPQYSGPPPSASYDATQAIGYGWKAFRAYAGPLLVISLLAILVPGAIQGIGTATNGVEGFLTFTADSTGVEFDFHPGVLVFNMIGSIVGLMLSAVAIRVAFDVVDGREVSVGNAFNRIDFVQVVVAAILVGVLVTIGLVLCFLPGILMLFMTFMTNYFIVGRGQSAITAIKSSISLVSANFGALLLLALLAFCVMVAGVLACLVGIFVAYPIVTVAAAFTFRYLHGEPIRPLQ